MLYIVFIYINIFLFDLMLGFNLQNEKSSPVALLEIDIWFVRWFFFVYFLYYMVGIVKQYIPLIQLLCLQPIKGSVLFQMVLKSCTQETQTLGLMSEHLVSLPFWSFTGEFILSWRKDFTSKTNPAETQLVFTTLWIFPSLLSYTIQFMNEGDQS